MDISKVQQKGYPPIPSSSPDESEEEQLSLSDEEELPFKSILNRFQRQQLLLQAKLFTVGSRSLCMDPLQYVMALVNGHPLESGDLNLGKADDEMFNFSRLFQKGTEISASLDTLVVDSDKTEKVQRFDVASPQQLLLANLAFGRLLERIILEEIQRSPQYAAFCNKALPDDFKEIEGISNKKIVEALKRCGLLDSEERLTPGSLMNKDVENALKKEVPSDALREKIIDVLNCIEFRSKPEMIRMRLTRSTFLDPRLLSKMSRGKLTPEDAHLLLGCLGFKTHSSPKMVCDLGTSEFPNEISTILRKNQSPPIIFVSPIDLKAKQPKIDLDKVSEDIFQISEGTKLITKKIFELVQNHLEKTNPNLWKIVKQEIPKAAADHTYLRELFFEPGRLQQAFKDAFINQHEKVEDLFSWFKETLSPRLEKLDALAATLPTKSDIMEECIIKEANNRLQRAIKAEEHLKKKFEEVKHILRPFLVFSTQNFELQQPHEFELNWKMADAEVAEKVTLEKSCAVMRRLHFPTSNPSDRTDLPYFDEQPKPSVNNRWNEICQKHGYTDSSLADLFLKLYREGSIDAPVEVKQFLAPLVILLMGKEPALDRASLLANFILFFSVKLGINSFSDALQSMPVIPQGAVSAKQFLLHTSEHPIDSLSGVQYKNKSKHLLPNHFLPTVSSFVGRADDWIQKYDDVATNAVQCCQRLFVGPIDENDPRFVEFKQQLENQTEGRELEIWELPLALDRQRMIEKITALEEICHRFALSDFHFAKSPSAHTKRAAVKYCRSVLNSYNGNEKVQQELIKPLHDFLCEEHPPSELAEILDLDFAEELILRKNAIANQFLFYAGEQDDPETALERSQAYFTRGIDPNQPVFQKLKALLEKVYQQSVPFAHLPSAIQYDIGLNDDDDEIGKWAIDYLFTFHPLAKIIDG